jgi:HAD superfamily hydrolase (TIGR01509 family)
MKAVIFDCDGVLLDSEAIGVEVELSCLAEIGLHYEREKYLARFLGGNTAFFFSSLDADHRAEFGAPLPDAFRDRIRTEIHDAFERDLDVIPGIPNLIESLDCAMAVASGSSIDDLQWKLRKTNLHALFDPHIFSADEVLNGKPAPDVFLLAAERLGMAPADCIVVEDGRNGVMGAVTAGMTAIGFTGGGHCDEDHGDSLLAAGARGASATVDALRETLHAILQIR